MSFVKIYWMAIVHIVSVVGWLGTAHAQSNGNYPDYFGPESREAFDQVRRVVEDLELAQGVLTVGVTTSWVSAPGILLELSGLSPDAVDAITSIDTIQRARIKQIATLLLVQHRRRLNEEEERFWNSVLAWSSRSPDAPDFGEPHLRTLDGLAYDFQAAGEFVVAKSADGNLEIQTRQEPWRFQDSVSANTAVAMQVAGDVVGIYARGNEPFLMNGQAAPRRDSIWRLPNGGTILHKDNRFLVVWPDHSQVQVTRFPSSHVDVVVSVSEAKGPMVRGLLGNYDGTQSNDLMTREGRIVNLPSVKNNAYYARLYWEFGNSWRIRQEDSLFAYDPGTSTDSYTNRQFPAKLANVASLEASKRRTAEQICRQHGVPGGPVLEGCVLDVALTGEEVFAQGAGRIQTSAAGLASETTYEERTNRYGSDYRSITLDSPDPVQCQNACVAETACRAWTFVKPRIQGPQARCWLKDRVPQPTTADCCVSGMKTVQ